MVIFFILNFLYLFLDDLRARLLAENPTKNDLYNLLKKVDLKSAQQIHYNNFDRVLRALEIYYATGKCKSEHLSAQNKNVISKFYLKKKINYFY